MWLTVEQIELYIRTKDLPNEQLFQNGCVFDAWNYVSALIREAKQEIVLIDKIEYNDELWRVMPLAMCFFLAK